MAKRKNEKSRNIVSFFMFLTVFILSSCICGKAFIANPNQMAKCLTERAYAEAVFNDAQQYAYDLCDKCSLPRNVVDEALNIVAVSDINEAYVIGNLCKSEDYNATTYQDRIDELSDEIESSVSRQIKDNNIKIAGSQAKNGAKQFSKSIADYLKSIVEIKYASKLQLATNVFGTVLIVLIVLSSILLLILLLSQLAIGKKKYRSLRAVSYSFISAGILDFIMVLGVEIVKLTKSLVIYPTYLRDAMMRFVEKSEGVVALAGLFSIALAIMIIAVGWRLKRDEK